MAQIAPWKGKRELKRFWVLAAQLGGEQFVYNTVWDRFKKSRLHELTRDEFLELLKDMMRVSRRCTCETHHGQASCAQYRRIKHLQRRLGWSDDRLTAYIRKYAHIDSIRFLTVPKARGIIAGMEKSIKLKEGETCRQT